MVDILDLLTPTEAKAALANNAGQANDQLLAAAVTGVSQFLDKLCGPIVVRTITDETHDGGDPYVFLRYRPVDSVATVTEYRHTTEVPLTEETPGVLPAEAFVVNELEGTIVRRRTGRDCCFAAGRKNIVVTYGAGRCAATLDVPERFKRAAGITLANYWRREHGGGGGAAAVIGVTYGLPDAAKAWIHRDIQGVMA
jgi:hypothetical protein